jgi:gluconolactonase
VAGGDGVQIFTPDGARIATLYVPEVPANICFGGADGHTLFITARHSVYRIRLNTAAPK